MNGLTNIHLELTSRCQKNCWMCGRRNLERDHPDLCNWGDMSFEFLDDYIRWQIPKGIVIQFFNNGEPTLYPELGRALNLFQLNIRCFNTNGKLLLEKLDEIKGNLETLTISVIEKDPEAESQFETVCKFIEKKGNEKPFMVYRLLGEVEKPERWEALPGIVVRRILHAPEGSFDYAKRTTVPEIGICLDLLNHLAIDRFGNVSPCVRYDPNGYARLGNIEKQSLISMWEGGQRQRMIWDHITQRRDKWPLCGGSCTFWGVPRG